MQIGINKYRDSLSLSLNQFLRKLRKEKILIIVASAHKVGSTWVYNILEKSCKLETYKINSDVIKNNPGISKYDINLEEILSKTAIGYGGYIHKSHSYPLPENAVVEIPGWIKFITVLRDPRDVIISASYYLAWLPEEEGGWDKNFRDSSPRMRILNVINNGKFLWDRLEKWFNCKYAYKVKYEKLINHGVNEIHGLLKALNLKVDKKKLITSYNHSTFKYQTGRDPGIENNKASLRKGVAEDWKNYFDNEIKNNFKTVYNGKWNDLLVNMGYEKDEYW